jgi:predicted glycosyltransferase
MSIAYTARASREGKWWVAEIEGIGATQGRNLREVEQMARDMVVAVLDVPRPDVEIVIVAELPLEIRKEVDEARDAITELHRRQSDTARKSRKAARDLVLGVGLTGRDASVILGVSPQRVSQLLAD